MNSDLPMSFETNQPDEKLNIKKIIPKIINAVPTIVKIATVLS